MDRGGIGGWRGLAISVTVLVVAVIGWIAAQSELAAHAGIVYRPSGRGPRESPHRFPACSPHATCMMLRRFAVVFAASATSRCWWRGRSLNGRPNGSTGRRFPAGIPIHLRRCAVSTFRSAIRFTQPGTDWTGAAIARLAGPVAAYNLIVLLSFPLAAASTDLLVFLLTGSSLGSAWAGLMVMLAPYHLAHAAYHPHVAQIGWQALALAAIVAFVDRPSALRAGGVAISMAWLGATDFYGGFIGLVLAPVVAIARVATQPAGTRDSRAPAAAGLIAVGSVATLAAVGWWLHARPRRAAVQRGPGADVPRALVGVFLPPVDQPWWGDRSVQVIGEAGVLPAIVELQLTPGFVALGLAAWGTRVAFTSGRAQERAAAGVALAIVTAATMASLGAGGDLAASGGTGLSRDGAVRGRRGDRRERAGRARPGVSGSARSHRVERW